MGLLHLLGNNLGKNIIELEGLIVSNRSKVTEEEAKLILEDYQKLTVRKSRRKWVSEINVQTILEWSKQPYWETLNVAEAQIKQDNPIYTHKYFPIQFFYEHGGLEKPEETILWMAKNFETANARVKFPGLIAEYTRRFENGDRTTTGYDKMLHFLWGPAIAIKYGEGVSNSLMYARKAWSFCLGTSRDEKADLKAHKEGIEFLKQVQGQDSPLVSKSKTQYNNQIQTIKT